MGKNGHTLVYGGGRKGLMGVVADAVLAEGGKAIGVIPAFLRTPEEAHTGLTALYTVQTMAERKARMREMGEAFLALPGGPGTLEEITEIISLKRLGKVTAPCLIYNVEGYYDELHRACEKMSEAGFLAYDSRELVQFPTSLEAVVEGIGQGIGME